MKHHITYLFALLSTLMIGCNPEIEQPPVSGTAAMRPVTTTTTWVPSTTIPRFETTTTTTTTMLPPTTTTSPPSTQPQNIVPAASGGIWDALAACETGRGGPAEWDYGIGHRWGSQLYDGGLQFHPDTWTGAGGTEFAPRAYLATREEQIVVGKRVQASHGWGAWPACSKKLGLR